MKRNMLRASHIHTQAAKGRFTISETRVMCQQKTQPPETTRSFHRKNESSLRKLLVRKLGLSLDNLKLQKEVFILSPVLVCTIATRLVSAKRSLKIWRLAHRPTPKMFAPKCFWKCEPVLTRFFVGRLRSRRSVKASASRSPL